MCREVVDLKGCGSVWSSRARLAAAVNRQRPDPSLPTMAGGGKGCRAYFFRQDLTRSYGFEDEDADQSCKLIGLKRGLVEVTAWLLCYDSNTRRNLPWMRVLNLQQVGIVAGPRTLRRRSAAKSNLSHCRDCLCLHLENIYSFKRNQVCNLKL